MAPSPRTLAPAQQDVVDHLLALGQPRPTFDEELPLRLLDRLEQGLADVIDTVADLGRALEVSVGKSALAQVHTCEAHHLAETDEPFEWSVASTRGTVAHKAVELSVFTRPSTRTDDHPELAPLALVDAALDRLTESDDGWGPGEFLRQATPTEIAEVRGAACDVVTKFQECFPPLSPQWRPRLESACRVELGGGAIVLRSKVDLALGRPVGQEARVLIVDLKTGRPYPAHLDDLRYYALLETLRSRVPPFRVASYYLEAARWQAEDVTEELLEVAARRVIGGVRKLVELRTGERKPATTPGPACTYCRLRTTCAGAQEWTEQRELAGYP